MTHPTHGFDPNALEAAPARSRLRLHHDLETTAKALFDRARRLDQVAGFGYEMADFLTDLVPFLYALSQNPGTSNTSGAAAPEEWRIWCEEWHSAVDSACLMLGLPVGMGAAEFVEAVRNYAASPPVGGAVTPVAEVPLVSLRPESTVPEWQQVIDLFEQHGLAAPPWRLRDELVNWLTWARYGEATALASSERSGREAPTHRHKKTGRLYVLIGFGKMQSDFWMTSGFSPAAKTVDMLEVAVYRAIVGGSLWVRPREEFEDGRFIKLSEVSHE